MFFIIKIHENILKCLYLNINNKINFSIPPYPYNIQEYAVQNL